MVYGREILINNIQNELFISFEMVHVTITSLITRLQNSQDVNRVEYFNPYLIRTPMINITQNIL